MAGLCCGQKHQNMSGMCSAKQASNLAWLKGLVVKNIIFIMAGMCEGQKTSDQAWPECVVLKNVIFSIAGMYHGKKRQIQHGQNGISS
jgi:hypothetical protein